MATKKAAPAVTEARPVRPCVVCGIEDDHPRHVFATEDGGTRLRHMDCCREAGCPDGTCEQVTAGAEDLRGTALVKHLTGK